MDWLDGAIGGAARGTVVGAIAGAIAVGVVGLAVLFLPVKKCPDCGRQLVPQSHRAASRQQALRGGWTCLQCGCEVDRRGRKIQHELPPGDPTT
jgi:hypothetical protein